jgi:hypothetical protein
MGPHTCRIPNAYLCLKTCGVKSNENAVLQQDRIPCIPGINLYARERKSGACVYAPHRNTGPRYARYAVTLQPLWRQGVVNQTTRQRYALSLR